jgi:hypothetical protein
MTESKDKLDTTIDRDRLIAALTTKRLHIRNGRSTSRLLALVGDRATGTNVMDEKAEQFTKWAHDAMDAARPRLLAGLAAMTAADPDASPERVKRLEERRGSLPRCTRTRTRMTLAEPRMGGSHTFNEDGLT